VVADPTGRYAAASLVQPDGTIRPVLWTDGEPAVLPPAGDGAQPSAVNSAGVVVGTASGRDGRPLAWIYRDGRVSRLGAVPGYEWWAPVSVDEHGAVTGEAWRGLRFAVVSWPSAASRGAVVRVTEPRGVRGSGVGAGGVVVGTWGDGAAPYAWRADGTGRALRLPRGAATGQPVAVRGAWAAGWVGLHPATVPPEPAAAPREQGGEKDMRLREMLGKPGAGKLVVAPARWNLSTGEVTHWPERTVAATAVNAAGWVVVPGDGGAAVVSPEGRMTALPGPADGYPTTLSDDNRRLYGERFPHGAEGDPFAEALAAKRLAKGVVTELLMWSC
jgi:probable HAF family extracellular repeat protein